VTIRDDEKFMESLWDWACLNGCFGETRISPTDIDGFVERRGHYLVLETKLPGNNIPQGQRLTFDAMAKDGNHTIIVIWGKPGIPEKIKVITWTGEVVIKPADIDTLRDLVGRWFNYADKN